MYRNLIIFLGVILLTMACSKSHDAPEQPAKGLNFSVAQAAVATPIAHGQTTRLALIIGNADYQHVPKLDNPVNDAKDMANILKKLGFQVILKTNIGNRAMTQTVRAFGTQLQQQGGVGLFFFSGHGLQTKGTNYLVPVDANINSNADIRWETLDANRVLAQMEQANNGVNIVILDACRDNPYKTNVKNLSKGLAKMKSPTGSLIAYATAPGQVSYGDSQQRNSIYTEYLLSALRDNQKTALSILDLLTDVTSHVMKKTKGKQVPWQSSSLTERFCLTNCGHWQGQVPDVAQLLQRCEGYMRLRWLTTGRGGTAFACYQEVLKKDPNNIKALAGLGEMQTLYAGWIERALNRGQPQKATQYLAGLRKIAPESPQVAEFEERLQAPRPQIIAPPPPAISVAPPSPAIDNNTAGHVFRDRLRDGRLGPEMVWIPAGRFRMGDLQGGGGSDEKPVHRVWVEKFAMGRYEVTVGEYLRFVRATGRHAPEWQEKGSKYNIKTGTEDHYKNLGSALTNKNHPIVGISWNDATAYAAWLSQQTGQKYRLPTEAEWEYAARAGTETKFWWGNQIGSNKANCSNNSCGDRFEYTAPVGSFQPNPFGLYDTVGNVWELTCSEYENRYNGKEKTCFSKNRAKSEGLFVLRGGSWYIGAWWARAASRGRRSRAGCDRDSGARLARI